MEKGKLWTVITGLSVVGVLLAVYLLWQQLFRPAFSPCTISATINCDAIISGEVAKTLGIPTPLFGLVGYLVIFASSLLHKKRILLATALFGLVFCLWIGYRELFELKVICPVCIMCQLIMVTIFSLAMIIHKKTVGTNK